MGMENKKFDVDTLLRNTLKSSEKPDTDLVRKLKNHTNNEEMYIMKNRKIMKPSLVAAVLIGVLAVSAAFAAPSIWRHLDTRIVEGEDYISNFEMKISQDGTTTVMGAEFHTNPLDGGLVKVQADGEYIVLSDPISFDNMDDATNISTLDNVLTPEFLPAGFAFQRVGFPINPLNHPDHSIAAGNIIANYSNGEDNIQLQIMQWDSEWGISIFSPNQVDITINDNSGAIADGIIMVIIDDVLYTVSASSLTQAELIRITESLR